MHLLSRDRSDPSNSTLAAIDSITGILDFLPSLVSLNSKVLNRKPTFWVQEKIEQVWVSFHTFWGLTFITAYPRRHETLSVDCLFLRSLLFSIGMPNFVLPNLDSVNQMPITVQSLHVD